MAPDLEPAQRPPLLQGSARSVVMPAGLGSTRTPLLQGLAWLFDSVPAALNVPSADRCLSLLLNTWSHDPGPRPNTSFAGNVFDLASQPARHSSMQEHAFAWSTLLSLYPDPIYCHQLLGMTKHSCLLGYNGPLRNADRHSNNLPISLAGHSHLCREINACLAEGCPSIIPAGTNLDLLAFVSQNPGCLLWKGNLEDAFQHVVTAERNAHLLGFSYDGICYLALAANALGLWLSPKKTFGASTKLEVLGIEIDTVAQTFGITNNRRHRILVQCHSLLQRRSADLLDMQQIAGLLQFIVLSPSPLTAAHIWTDACPKGYGGYLGLNTSPTAVFAKTIPCRHHKKNICFLEALAVLEALQRFLPHWSGPTLIVVHVDNKNIKHGLRSGHSRNPLTQRLLREIFGLCLKHNLTIWLQRVLSTDNVLADLSHQHFPFIQLLFPRAHDTLFSHPACTVALQVPHLASLPVLASLLVPPTSCGMALPPAPAAMPGARPRPSSPSASNILGSAHPVFWPRASNCWSGLPTSPALVALSTWPSMGLVPSNPTTWTLASTPQVLLAMGKMADLFPQDRLVLQAAFTLAFACFLCSGELVWDCATNRATILTVSSIKWAFDHVVLTLPASKTNPFRQGVRVVTPEVGGVKCPVACLQHLSHGHPPSALLFSLGPSGLDSLPWSTFVTILCCTIQACSLLALQYASHSFCHGTATWVLQHSASTANIQSLGQWSSNCYRHYINRLAQERRTLVAPALFSVHNGPLVPSGPAWRDPGLA
ncbi:hypothetical protein NDA13_005265 [Ustilago tritici]|nr:hypothetical protein NDA13_005265 [Ustilago tritici]